MSPDFDRTTPAVSPERLRTVRRFVGWTTLVYWGALFIATHVPLPPLPASNLGSDKVAHIAAFAGLGFLTSLWLSLGGKLTMGRALLARNEAIFAFFETMLTEGVTPDQATQIQKMLERGAGFMDIVAGAQPERQAEILRVLPELAPHFEQAIHSLKGLPNVIDIRNCGLMGAVELEPRPGAAGKRAYEAFLKVFADGVLIRWTGDTLAFSPPLIVEKAQIDRIFESVRSALAGTP